MEVPKIQAKDVLVKLHNKFCVGEKRKNFCAVLTKENESVNDRHFALKR